MRSNSIHRGIIQPRKSAAYGYYEWAMEAETILVLIVAKRGYKEVLLVWRALIWALWRTHNYMIFFDKGVEVEEEEKVNSIMKNFVGKTAK
jgi:hypothetical protein